LKCFAYFLGNDVKDEDWCHARPGECGFSTEFSTGTVDIPRSVAAKARIPLIAHDADEAGLRRSVSAALARRLTLPWAASNSEES